MVGNNHLWFGSNKIQLPQDNSIPSGVIAMWSGASNAIPAGWVLCDGQNGAPDLRNRFIVGAGSSYSVGATGGSDTVSLNTNQIPAHSHGFSLSAASAGAHTHGHTFGVSLRNLKASNGGAHTHTTTRHVWCIFKFIPKCTCEFYIKSGWRSHSHYHGFCISYRLYFIRRSTYPFGIRFYFQCWWRTNT